VTDALTDGDRRVVHSIVYESDLLTVRSVLRQAAKAAGLGLVAETKLITAGSEMARNILKYTPGGTFEVSEVRGERDLGVRAVFADDGPGIPDVEAAMTDGFTTSGSLGLGLPGTKRLVDEFHIVSAPGGPTVVTMTMWAR
jgi:serine/threonine-protein kinase RsbT